MAGTGRIRLRPVVPAALAVAAALSVGFACGGSEPADATGSGSLELRRIASFRGPVHVDDAPGRRKLLFVVEQRGTVAVLRKGRKLDRPFLDIRDRVRTSYEEGLLSIAFDPEYKRNRRFYVYYVNRDGDVQVDRFRRKRGSATRASRSSRRTVIVIGHPGENHFGGQLQFGPDGFLYLGTGDGEQGDPDGNAQDPTSLLGKLLRIDPRRGAGYDSPPSNPFVGAEGRDEVYSLGLRNPWRFSFDRETGDLSIGDVGQESREELDHLPTADARGANFGWNLLEGSRFYGEADTEPPRYVPPIHDYAARSGSAVIGGYVVRDPSLPALAGRLLYTDLAHGQLRSLDPDAPEPAATDAATGLRVGQPASFGEGIGGRLYVTSLEDGSVYRVVER